MWRIRFGLLAFVWRSVRYYTVISIVLLAPRSMTLTFKQRMLLFYGPLFKLSLFYFLWYDLITNKIF